MPRRILTDAFLAQADDLLRVFFSHERWARSHLTYCGQPVLNVGGEKGHSQVCLQERLLVDSEQHLTVLDGVENARRQVEGAELEAAAHLATRLECLQRRIGARGTERYHPVRVRVLAQRHLDAV